MRNDPVIAAGARRILINIRGSTVVHREDAFKASTTPELIPVWWHSEMTVR
jgi:uncharacterized protein YndB with AHSA1/START domain